MGMAKLFGTKDDKGGQHPMIEVSEMDQFKKRVYDKFEGNCQHVLSVSDDMGREVLLERGQDIFEGFEAAYEFAGMHI